MTMQAKPNTLLLLFALFFTTCGPTLAQDSPSKTAPSKTTDQRLQEEELEHYPDAPIAMLVRHAKIGYAKAQYQLGRS